MEAADDRFVTHDLDPPKADLGTEGVVGADGIYPGLDEFDESPHQRANW